MYLFQDSQQDYLFYPMEEVGYEGDVKVLNKGGRFVFEHSLVYIDDLDTDVELEQYGECDIVVVPIGNGLLILDSVLKINKPKIVLFRNYKTVEYNGNLLGIGEQLIGLAERGLIKFAQNPCNVVLPKYPPEIWIMLVGGDSYESIMRGRGTTKFNKNQ